MRHTAHGGLPKARTINHSAMVEADSIGVLESTQSVVESARFVRINSVRLRAIAEQWVENDIAIPAWNSRLHWSDGGERTVNWIFVLDALNFSFWGEPRWTVTYQSQRLSGYWALAASLKRAMEEGVPLTDASYLAQLTEPELAHILRGDGFVPLLEYRVANLREIGRILLARYNASFARLVEAAQGSAVSLVKRVVAEFPSFNDVSTYNNREVRFYKRAQILVGDLWGAFGGERWGAFRDLDRIAAFADYRLPQALRYLGIIEYAPQLAALVDAEVQIEHGSPEEIEIRAATIWAVELLRRRLVEQGRPLLAFQIDWYLWELITRMTGVERPFHRTRTIFY